MRDPAANDTIFALSSGRLPAGLAVLRLSGPNTFPAIEALSGALPAPRMLSLRSIRSRTGEVIDEGMVVVFPGPNSFTGEDCAELHLHGGRAVVSATLRALEGRPGLRYADAGEFSLRAFANGKFDLTRAEALADLIDAETEAQRRFAIANTSGRNAALYAAWREKLLVARALIEAELDFPEEDDIPGSVSDQVWETVKVLADEIDIHLKGYRSAEIIRDGYRVAIVGAPNVGKSSLLNALANRDVAIVSDEPGTTRDLVEVALDLGGMKIVITDTAGIRDGAGRIEQEGIARARAAANRADLLLVLQDSDSPVPIASTNPDGQALYVRSKSDLIESDDSRETASDLTLSVVTGDGMADLVARIALCASDAAVMASDAAPFRERHAQELTASIGVLRSFLEGRDAPLELAAEQLRLATNHLARIVGVIDVEDLLDVVFSRFCIGK